MHQLFQGNQNLKSAFVPSTVSMSFNSVIKVCKVIVWHIAHGLVMNVVCMRWMQVARLSVRVPNLPYISYQTWLPNTWTLSWWSRDTHKDCKLVKHVQRLLSGVMIKRSLFNLSVCRFNVSTSCSRVNKIQNLPWFHQRWACLSIQS